MTPLESPPVSPIAFFQDLNDQDISLRRLRAWVCAQGKSSQRGYDPPSLMPSPILRSAWPLSPSSDVSVSAAGLKSEGAEILVSQTSWEPKTGEAAAKTLGHVRDRCFWNLCFIPSSLHLFYQQTLMSTYSASIHARNRAPCCGSSWWVSKLQQGIDVPELRERATFLKSRNCPMSFPWSSALSIMSES